MRLLSVVPARVTSKTILLRAVRVAGLGNTQSAQQHNGAIRQLPHMLPVWDYPSGTARLGLPVRDHTLHNLQKRTMVFHDLSE